MNCENTLCMKTDFTLDSGYDGLHLSGLMVRPEDKPVAVLQLAHGMCGCKERYLPFMEYMSEHGVACVACDHRGHGASVLAKEDLGYMYSGGYVALVEDMKAVSDWTRQQFPDIPLFLMGHSMGALAARIYTKKYDSLLSGLIVSGNPGYTPMSRIGVALMWAMTIFKEGRLRMSVLQDMTSARFNRRFADEGKMAWMCSDPNARKAFMDNPLCHFNFTANGMYNLLRMMVESNSKTGWSVANPGLPVTFLSGEDDPCMRGEKNLHDSAKMMYGLGYHNVTAALFVHMRHEILNEFDKKLVWDDVLSFVKKYSS